MRTAEQAKALTVLSDTVGSSPAKLTGRQVTPTGVRLVSMMNSTGYLGISRKLTVAEILQISAVMACLDVLAQDIAKVNLRLYRRLPGGGKEIVLPREHPIAFLLATEPNPWMTWPQLIEQVMLNLGLTQNAFLTKAMNSVGSTRRLVPAMPARARLLAVSPDEDPNGRGFFALSVDRYTAEEEIFFQGMPGVFLSDEFIHFRGRSFDGLYGYSNLEAGARVFGMASEILDYQTRVFKNDGAMRGVFSHPQNLGDPNDEDGTYSNDAFQRLRAQLAENFNDFRREAKPIVLEEGMQFNQISMTAEAAQSDKARDNAIVEAARMFRMPPHKIQHLINVKYENLEALEKSYARDTLIPYATRLEKPLDHSLLTPEERLEYFIQFDRNEFLFGDAEKLGDMVDVMSKYAAITVDEIRQVFNYNPLPNGAGKVRILPSTNALIDDKNEVIVAAGGVDPNEPAPETAPAQEPGNED